MSIIAKGKPLLEEMRALLRRQGYAYGAEDAYCDWVRRFVKFSKVQKKSALFKNTEKKVEKYKIICQRCYSIFFALAISHRDLFKLKINILHPKVYRFCFT
jgi:hypothetical protein